MSFWCESRQSYVTVRCACCKPEAARPAGEVNECGEIVRGRRPGGATPRTAPTAPFPPVDWAEVVRETPPQGQHVTHPQSPYRSAKIWCECQPPLAKGVAVQADNWSHGLLRCPACWRIRNPSSEPPLRPAPSAETRPSPRSLEGRIDVWCSCWLPHPEAVSVPYDGADATLVCSACRIRRRASPRTVRPWERAVVLFLLLLAAVVAYIGWRF